MVEISLAETVQHLVESDISLQDALERNYANTSAVARLLKPKAEEFCGRKVTLQGMITSVRRARTGYRPRQEHLEVVAGSVINLRTDVAKISLEKTRRNLERARLVSVDFPEAFFQVLEGTATLTLVTEQRIFGSVRSVFKGEEILDEKQNLAAIVVQSPKGIVHTAGCIAAFYNLLSKARINIEETVSCFTETIILLQMEDATKAFGLLADLIANSRRILNTRV